MSIIALFNGYSIEKTSRTVGASYGYAKIPVLSALNHF